MNKRTAPLPFLPTAVLILLIGVSILIGLPARHARGAPPEKPGTRSAHLEVTPGVRYDNNAFLDRRGQFGAKAETHLIGLIGMEGSFDAELAKWMRFSMSSEINMEELHIDVGSGSLTDELRRTSVQTDPSLVFEPVARLEISLTPSLMIQRETDAAWSFLQVTPTLEISYVTPCGLHMEASYTYTGKFFDSDALTETYGNVDLQSHRGHLTMKHWLFDYLRGRLTADVERSIYDKNIDVLLGRIVFLPIDQFENPDAEFTREKRYDWTFKTEAELVYVPFDWGLIAVGYRFDQVVSNLDPFTYRGHGPRLALAVKHKGHEAYAEGKLTFKHFYDFRFDTRFADTRRDYKIDVYAAYGYVINDWVRVDATYSFLRNDSNDAENFDFGHSRSYSLYQRSKVEVSATFSFDFIHTPKPDEPELPGTILAKASD
jgi:hypothetical protein